VKVLVLTSSYPRFAGDPTAPFMESIVRHLAARGHEISVVLPESAEWRRPAQEDGIRYHPYRYSPSRSWTPWGYSAALEGGARIKRPLYALAPVVAASAVRMTRSVAAREGVDLVHAHWVVPNGPIAALATRSHAPLIVTLHGSDLAVAERSQPIARISRWTFDRSTAVTAPSSDLAVRAGRLGAKDVVRIPWGADPDRFPVDDVGRLETRRELGLHVDDLVVAAVGRLLPLKGFDDFLRAGAQAARSVPHLRLLLIGEGDDRARLESMAHQLGLESRAVFTGAVDWNGIARYYAAADVVAIPSIHHRGYVDGLPTTAFEAMAAAKPIIATRVGGLPDVVRDSENGVLVPERRPDTLSAAIVALAGDPALRERLGAHGRVLVEKELNWDVVARRLEELYERVLGA
jgi:glycosyltransferase involved in cell wall biosynthesis